MIRIDGMSKHYQMGDSIVHALDSVDLAVGKGEFVSITGASGSGKSTIMHLIGCLDRPTSGAYLLADQRVDRLSDRRLARIRNTYIGFVFQTFNLINRTSALENVALPLMYARRGGARGLAMKALDRVGLSKRALHKPSELSGGERQRVAIARALVNNPPLLLADEPTGNLDSRTGEQILELFHELHRDGVTIALVTHEMAVAAQAQRVVRMKDGRIIEDRKVDDAFRLELLADRLQAEKAGEAENRDSPGTL
jgi:putative ABC transport system ATP-binding protein